jgi:hypothetical protein
MASGSKVKTQSGTNAETAAARRRGIMRNLVSIGSQNAGDVPS